MLRNMRSMCLEASKGAGYVLFLAHPSRRALFAHLRNSAMGRALLRMRKLMLLKIRVD
jgi:hypothetical protein